MIGFHNTALDEITRLGIREDVILDTPLLRGLNLNRTQKDSFSQRVLRRDGKEVHRSPFLDNVQSYRAKNLLLHKNTKI